MRCFEDRYESNPAITSLERYKLYSFSNFYQRHWAYFLILEVVLQLIDALQGFDYSAPDHRILALSLIMILSGFISGITGFGFSLCGAVALFIYQPKELVPLLLILSTFTQLTSMWSLRASMIPLRRWWSDGPLPFVLGGCMGIPAGIWVLYNLNAQALCELVGFIIVGYVSWSLMAKPKKVKFLLLHRSRLLTGFLGGTVGGFTAAPALLIVIWASMAGITKEKLRAITQPFIVCIQLVTIYEQMMKPGAIPDTLVNYALLLCIFVLPANHLGVAVFKRIDEGTFRSVVMILLAIMGIALINKGFHVWGELFLSIHLKHHQFGVG